MRAMLRLRPAVQKILPFFILLAAAFACYGGWHIARLGFYGDDWSYIQILRQTPSVGLAKMTLTLLRDPLILSRPLYICTRILEYLISGIQPSGYHVIDLVFSVVLANCVYLLLRDFACSKPAAILGAMLLLAYPSKDTTMFLTGPFLIALLMFLVSYLAHLRYLRTGKNILLGLSALALLASLVMYDSCIFMWPIYCIIPDRRKSEPLRLRRSVVVMAAITLFVLAYKVILPRVMGIHLFTPLSFSFAHALFVYPAAINANLGPDQIICTLQSVGEAFRTSPSLTVFALALPVIATCLLQDDGLPSETATPSARPLLAFGFDLFLLGYFPCMISAYTPVPTSVDDRINLVPALGVILIAVGLLARSGRRWRYWLLCGLTGTALASSIGIAQAWEQAYCDELTIRQAIFENLAQWPRDKILVLHTDSLFALNRTAVFDTRSAFEPAVQFWTEDDSRQAYVITPTASFLPKALLFRSDFTGDELHNGKLVLIAQPGQRPDTLIPYDKTVLLDISSHSFLPNPGYADYARLSIPPHLHNPFATWVKSFRRRVAPPRDERD